MPLRYSTASGIAAFVVLVGPCAGVRLTRQIATLFFWLSAFSVPFIDRIYYVRTRENNVRYGSFGWCAGPPSTGGVCYQNVGYRWDGFIPSGENLTRAHILVALTAGFSSLAFFSLLASMRDFRSGICSFFLVHCFTTFWATLSFILVIPTWAIAHRRFDNASLDPIYGPAFILVIIGWLLYLLAVPLVVIGWIRERRIRRDGTYTTTTTTTTRRKWF